MGVTKLWTLLMDSCQNDITVSSLHGQTIAVDLSSWICELKRIQIAQTIPNLYLKNLYYRTTYFMKQGIKLVFVEDGTAPEIKRTALAQRNKNRNTNLDRIGLKNISEKCRELLNNLGLPCIQSLGEAEAFCAQLNYAGVVDGVLTSDGDALLYGAKKVYRNFKMDVGTVDCCDMVEVEKKLNIERRGLITMAMLSGCDYDKDGVQSVGVQKAYEFIQLCTQLGVDPLTRIMTWRTNSELKTLQKVRESPQKKPSHCNVCKHLGSKPDHFKNGCVPCDTEQSCDQDNQVSCTCDSCTVDLHKFELNTREKALRDPGFPNQMIVDEFLQSTNEMPLSHLEWKPVKVSSLKFFLQNHIRWTNVEFFNKISELLVILQVNGMEWTVSEKLTPVRIVRKSTLKKTPSVIVEWTKLSNDTVTENSQVITVSEENFSRHYPSMLQEFNRRKEEEKTQKLEEKNVNKKGKKRKDTKSNKGQRSITDCFAITKKARRSPTPPVKHTESSSEEDIDHITITKPKNAKRSPTPPVKHTGSSSEEDIDHITITKPKNAKRSPTPPVKHTGSSSEEDIDHITFTKPKNAKRSPTPPVKHTGSSSEEDIDHITITKPKNAKRSPTPPMKNTESSSQEDIDHITITRPKKTISAIAFSKHASSSNQIYDDDHTAFTKKDRSSPFKHASSCKQMFDIEHTSFTKKPTSSPFKHASSCKQMFDFEHTSFTKKAISSPSKHSGSSSKDCDVIVID
ncbi:flap endonuclease GEN homolog 1-like [Mytilus trossulus]|uniref:flap endonuclease GEN homolog 1-like n=1 Tax=Mytilus trossulus TaxID=6551 RepID=UPI0030047E24